MLWTNLARRICAIVLGGAALTASLTGPALAASQPSTRLVSCGQESCLLVSGRRTDATSAVFVNGREVKVEGAQKWRTRVPVNILRKWSSPFAHTVTISVADASTEADLPIGLFAHIEDIAMLTITAK